jgi:hypothetical protein
MSSKEKPDYTKFMRKPAAIQLSPPSDPGDSGCGPIKEKDIPWAEIIEEAEPQNQTTPTTAPVKTAEKSAAASSVGIVHAPAAIGREDQLEPMFLSYDPMFFSYEPPPLPVLALALPLLLVLMI